MREAIFHEIETALQGTTPYAGSTFAEAIEMLEGELSTDLHLVAGPGELPEGGVQPEDVFVRVAPGEAVGPLIGRVTSHARWAGPGELAQAEYGAPGFYSRVAPVGVVQSFGHRAAVTGPRYRRVLDPHGRVAPNTLLLRRRYVGPLYQRAPQRPNASYPLRHPFYRKVPIRPAFMSRPRSWYRRPLVQPVFAPVVTPAPAPTPIPMTAPPEPATPPPAPVPEPHDPYEPAYGGAYGSEPPLAPGVLEPGLDEPTEPADPGGWEPPDAAPVEFAAAEKDAALPGLRVRIVTAALREWEGWERGSRKEFDPRMHDRLFSYWMSVRNERDAKDAIAKGLHWSAAFISWVMRAANAGDAFNYSALHVEYVAAAKHARALGDASKFWAYELGAAKPEVGDLVCRDRERDGVCSGTTYANVDDGTPRASHCDVVTFVGPRGITCVGGNISDSVRSRRYELDDQGFVRAEQGGGCRCYAIVKPPRSLA
jgi:hypothetical protein